MKNKRSLLRPILIGTKEYRFKCVVPMATFLLGAILGHLHGRLSVTMSLSSSLSFHNNNNNDNPFITTNDGWRNVHVFQGKRIAHLEQAINKLSKTEPFIGQERPKWFSQCSQDELVLGLLNNKQGGYFIDLAANHGVDFSNTLALELRGHWHGLCIEPNPMYWYSLSYYRTCHVVAAVVGGGKSRRLEPIDFVYDGGVYGGIVGNYMDNNNDTLSKHQRTATQQFAVPLAEIFQRLNVPHWIDYMSLDVEGAESLVLQDFPLKNYKFSILTVERPQPSLTLWLNQSGYILLKTLSDFGETLWAHQSVLPTLNLTVLDRPIVIREHAIPDKISCIKFSDMF